MRVRVISRDASRLANRKAPEVDALRLRPFRDRMFYTTLGYGDNAVVAVNAAVELARLSVIADTAGYDMLREELRDETS